MIADLQNANRLIKEDKIDLLPVCYGGCCSNTLVTILEENGYNTYTHNYRLILCHCPIYIDIDIPIIYIYDNPIKSFLSMKRRGNGYWDINQQKLSNNYDVELTDENLLKLMINQFNNWTSQKKDNILIIKSDELFEPHIKNKLELFLKKKLINFPLKYEKPITDIENILSENEDLKQLFEKYKDDIDRINNFLIQNN
jgi:hypothetical protein